MRYFVPDIKVVEEAPDVTEKLGGIPFGLPSTKWPRCSVCGGSQSLLAQFAHNNEHLDLGRPGRVLFVFQCNHDPGMCDTWEAFSGANACFVVEPENLTGEDSALPDDSPPLDPEVRIVEWLERDDGLSQDIADKFKKDYDYIYVPEPVQKRVTYGTRHGGIPRWIQNADEAPKDGWVFVAQLDQAYSFLSPPQQTYAWVKPDAEYFEDRVFVAEGPNFGGGLGFVFLRHGNGVPEGCFFWQR